jgi:hypothetical protein
MSIKDIIGLLLSAVGVGIVGIGTLGYRWLGLAWFWIGVASLVYGLFLVLNAIRERKLLKEWRDGVGAGDYGDRYYFSEAGCADFSSGSYGGGGGD